MTLGDGMDFDISAHLTQPDNKSFDFPLSERHYDAAARLQPVLSSLIDEGPDQRQTDRDIRIHALGTEAGTARRESASCLPRLRASCREIAGDRQDGTSQ